MLTSSIPVLSFTSSSSVFYSSLLHSLRTIEQPARLTASLRADSSEDRPPFKVQMDGCNSLTNLVLYVLLFPFGHFSSLISSHSSVVPFHILGVSFVPFFPPLPDSFWPIQVCIIKCTFRGVRELIVLSSPSSPPSTSWLVFSSPAKEQTLMIPCFLLKCYYGFLSILLA